MRTLPVLLRGATSGVKLPPRYVQKCVVLLSGTRVRGGVCVPVVVVE